MTNFWETAAGCSLYFSFVILVSSRFSFEGRIRVLIVTVSGHCLLVTFSISKLNIKGDYRMKWKRIDRKQAYLVFNPIMVEGYAALFSCTAVVQASDSMTASM